VLVGAGVAVLLAADAVWAGLTALGASRDARSALDRGAEAMLAGDLAAAATAFTDAERLAASVGSFDRHPSVVLAGLLPRLGDDVDAVDALAGSARHAAAAGLDLVAAARATGWNGRGTPGFRTGGDVDLDGVRAAEPHLDGAVIELRQATDLLTGLGEGGLIAPLDDARREASAIVADRASTVEVALGLTDLLPSMLGGDEPRRYVVAIQNLSAPRGTGGYLGFLGILTAVDGDVALESLQPTARLGTVEAVPVPREVAARYGRFGVQTTPWAANYSPDVPTSSDVVLAQAEAAGLGRFDGVIWVDTLWMADMLRAVGPVEVPMWPEPITADGVVEILNRRSFETDDEAASNELQSAVGLAVWDAVLTRDPDLRAFASAMAASVARGSFAATSLDDDEQGTIAELGAAGTFRPEGHPLAVVWQDASANRAGYFATFDVEHEVTLDAEGGARMRTVASMENGAPDEPPSILLGFGTDGVPIGWWGVNANVYLPVDAEIVAVTSRPTGVAFVEEEFGVPVATGYLAADPGADASVEVTSLAPAAAPVDGDERSYRLTVLPRPLLTPATFRVSIAVPEGASVSATAPGMTVADGVVRWEGAPTEPVELWVRYG
jgi:hypothetical protein